MRALILDGHYPHSLPIARELVRVLDAQIAGVAPNFSSYLHRSRFVSHRYTAPLPSDSRFIERLIDIINTIRPDVVVPVGYDSHKSIIQNFSRLPNGVKLLVPDDHSFRVAEDKQRTYELAQSVGIRYPRSSQFTSPQSSEDFQYPVFAKSRLERGGVSTALIHDSNQFRAFNWSELGADVLIQEFIDGDPYTYAHCGFYSNGDPVSTFQHVETRSVPRRGGSGTRLKVYEDAELQHMADTLLKALSWTGIVQVEFKKNSNGQYVLMEINPKFWASYALSSKAGANIGASAVSSLISGKPKSLAESAPKNLEMVFPIREALHVFASRELSGLRSSIGSMLWPPARPDFELMDPFAIPPLPRSSVFRG